MSTYHLPFNVMISAPTNLPAAISPDLREVIPQSVAQPIEIFLCALADARLDLSDPRFNKAFERAILLIHKTPTSDRPATPLMIEQKYARGSSNTATADLHGCPMCGSKEGFLLAEIIHVTSHIVGFNRGGERVYAPNGVEIDLQSRHPDDLAPGPYSCKACGGTFQNPY